VYLGVFEFLLLSAVGVGQDFHGLSVSDARERCGGHVLQTFQDLGVNILLQEFQVRPATSASLMPLPFRALICIAILPKSTGILPSQDGCGSHIEPIFSAGVINERKCSYTMRT
jgi:hypothetical protein